MSGSETQESRPQPVLPDKPGGKWIAVVGGLVIVFVILAGYDLLSNGSSLGSKAAPSPSPSRSTRATGAPARSGKRGMPSGAVAVLPSAAPVAVRELSVVSAAAFGPDGTSDGDNPDIASYALHGQGDGWVSAWYATAHFGGLQPGTGLLLDMGKPVSISSVRVKLGDSAGADLQIRLGDTPRMADLYTAATASGVGGGVLLPLPSPVSAQYVLLWFTKLPPDPAGTYQVRVYNVTVDGQPAGP